MGVSKNLPMHKDLGNQFTSNRRLSASRELNSIRSRLMQLQSELAASHGYDTRLPQRAQDVIDAMQLLCWDLDVRGL